MQPIVTQSPTKLQRDALGRFTPTAPEAWLQRSQERSAAHQRRLERLEADYGAWAAETGTSLAELESMFA